MFRRVRQVNATVEYLRERLPYYGPLVQRDLHEFSKEIVGTTVGLGIAAAAGVLLACFVSLAVIVSAWDSHHRVLVAWLVCLVWAVIATAGLLIARASLSGRSVPFRHVGDALARDYAHLTASIQKEE